MTPAEEIAMMIGHYLRELTRLAGKRWQPENERNIARLAELLSDLGGNVETHDTIPPYRTPQQQRRPVTTQTTPLHDDLAEAAAVARMTRRNGQETRR